MPSKKQWLHLACGPNVVPDWINVDIIRDKGIINHDLRKPLPYADASIDAIFHEHFIEHLDKVEGEKFLLECHRVLKKGAPMRIGWPDLRKLINAYYFRKQKYKNYILPFLENHKFGNNWDEILSDCLFDWEHRYAYTARHLAALVKTLGFKKVSVMKYKKSDYNIALDFRNDPATTYLEMIKR